MLVQALSLTAIGIGFVFGFLLLLVATVRLLAAILPAAPVAAQTEQPAQSSDNVSTEKHAAMIAATMHHHKGNDDE